MYPNILIIPVHVGGELFREALLSVKPILHKFSKVLISLNSGELNSKEMEIVEQILGKGRDNVRILVQGTLVGPTKHFSLILRELDVDTPINSSTMILAHDDLIDPIQFEENFASIGSLDNIAIFGDWHVTRDRNQIDRTESSIYPNMFTTPTAWIAELGLSHTFTNISGMVAPLSSFVALSKHMRNSKAGARSEYVVATHTSVKKIIRFSKPHIKIYEHGNQEGAKVINRDYHRDEIRFQLWLWRNCRIGSLKFSIISIIRLFYSSWNFFVISLKDSGAREDGA